MAGFHRNLDVLRAQAGLPAARLRQDIAVRRDGYRERLTAPRELG